MRGRERILLSDYAGHGFTAELAASLRQQRGIDVLYSYCSTVTTPKGRLDEIEVAIPVPAGRSFEKYRPWRRLLSEFRYGLNTARLVHQARPTTHVVCNMPLFSLLVVWLAGLSGRLRLIVWFQDAQSGLAGGMFGCGLTYRTTSVLEGFLLRRADRVIAISGELANEALRRRVSKSNIVVLENWAPIDLLPVTSRENGWSLEHGLLDVGCVFMYSGTLGRKHRAQDLVDLARAVAPRGGEVVVVSEGEGADWLTQQKALVSDLDNLRVLSYQPFRRLPEVLASADVLVVLLDRTAGQFSVPSKTLSYLCAGRPVLASMSTTNTAARILSERAGAGFVCEPGDVEAFLSAADRLAGDADLRIRLGTAGRRYAKANFDTEIVLDRFLAAIRFTLQDGRSPDDWSA